MEIYIHRRSKVMDCGCGGDARTLDPPQSEAQRRAMYAAAEGRSTLGIPKNVGKEFVGKDAMTYIEAKATRNALEDEVKRCSSVLKSFPKGSMGMVPDDVKKSPIFKAAKSDYDRAFAKLRSFNEVFLKEFAKEIREDRR